MRGLCAGHVCELKLLDAYQERVLWEQVITRSLGAHADTLFDMLLYANIKTRMVNDYFVKTDRASMFNSLHPILKLGCSAFHVSCRKITGKSIPN